MPGWGIEVTPTQGAVCTQGITRALRTLSGIPSTHGKTPGLQEFTQRTNTCASSFPSLFYFFNYNPNTRPLSPAPFTPVHTQSSSAQSLAVATVGSHGAVSVLGHTVGCHTGGRCWLCARKKAGCCRTAHQARDSPRPERSTVRGPSSRSQALRAQSYLQDHILRNLSKQGVQGPPVWGKQLRGKSSPRYPAGLR